MKKAQCFIYILLPVIFFAVDGRAEKKILLDGLMAKVNEHSITIGDVMQQVQPLQRQLIAKYKGEELRSETRRLFNKSLDNLIENKLIIDSYKEQKGQIPEWAVDNRINEILHEVFHDDRAAMMRALADDNLTYDHWKNNMRDQMIVASMRQANVQQRIKISAIDVQKYYELHTSDYEEFSTVRLQVIVLKEVATETRKDLMQKALDLLQQLRNGTDFYQAAKKYSLGHAAEDGGDWGWMEPTDLCSELQDAIAELKDGEFSDVIEVGNELYIMKVFARKPGSVKSFTDARAEIEGKLRNEEGRRIHNEWISALKKNAQVEIIDIDPFAGD